MEKLKNITELSKLLNLINPKTNKSNNYIIRYWEKEFKQVKPVFINKRRYYTEKQVEDHKMIKFLLKDQGMTIEWSERNYLNQVLIVLTITIHIV